MYYAGGPARPLSQAIKPKGFGRPAEVKVQQLKIALQQKEQECKRRMKKLQLTLAAKGSGAGLAGTDSENQAELLDAELHRMIVQNNKM